MQETATKNLSSRCIPGELYEIRNIESDTYVWGDIIEYKTGEAFGTFGSPKTMVITGLCFPFPPEWNENSKIFDEIFLVGDKIILIPRHYHKFTKK